MRALLFASILIWPGIASTQDAQLLMGERDGCYWCERWNQEIGGIYPKTDKGERAPLVSVDINAPLPEGITLKRRIHYTPTFILLVDGVEHDRIEGYPGEDFFWGLLSMLIENAGLSLDEAS